MIFFTSRLLLGISTWAEKAFLNILFVGEDNIAQPQGWGPLWFISKIQIFGLSNRNIDFLKISSPILWLTRAHSNGDYHSQDQNSYSGDVNFLHKTRRLLLFSGFFLRISLKEWYWRKKKTWQWHQEIHSFPKIVQLDNSNIAEMDWKMTKTVGNTICQKLRVRKLCVRIIEKFSFECRNNPGLLWCSFLLFPALLAVWLVLFWAQWFFKLFLSLLIDLWDDDIKITYLHIHHVRRLRCACYSRRHTSWVHKNFCRFSNPIHKFFGCGYENTKGMHICFHCLIQHRLQTVDRVRFHKLLRRLGAKGKN